MGSTRRGAPANSVVSASIVDGAVTVSKLGASAVETSKIRDSHVTTAKIADANVTATKLAAGQKAAEHFSAGPVDVSGSRTRNVIYQNTDTTARFVNISMATGNADVDILVGPASPPTVVVCVVNAAAQKRDLAFLVPAGWYYEYLRNSGTTDAIEGWVETVL